MLTDHLGMFGGLVLDGGSCGMMRSSWDASSVARSLCWVLLLILLLEVREVGHIVDNASVVRIVVHNWGLVDNGSSVDDGGVVDDSGSVDDWGVVDDSLVNNDVVVRLF